MRSKKFAETAGKQILKEIAKATGDLIGNKIADKITAKPHNKDEVINGIPKERYYQKKDIFLLKKDKSLLMN